MKKYWPLLLIVLGVADSAYLTYEHFSQNIPPCTTDLITLVDCGRVLKSKYAELLGVPLAVWGLVHYLGLGVNVGLGINGRKLFKHLAIVQSGFGVGFSIYLVYLQLIVIQSICLYCMGSAIVSLGLFLVIWAKFSRERIILVQKVMELSYVYGLRRILFLIDSETVHNWLTGFGERSGKANDLMRPLLVVADTKLKQNIAGIKLDSPVGLAAGFDYEARLTQSLAGWGWGFQTVGTITNLAYQGNDKPRLGRLPKSKSLLVNKGFKNLGAKTTAEKLAGRKFQTPIGVSIGQTNSSQLKTAKMAIEDICQAFKTFESSGVLHSYYELNISCPNLKVLTEFSQVKNLSELLSQIDRLKLTRPVFIKMPIDKSESEFKALLKEIVKHKVAGIIIGNLQKNRLNPNLNKDEVAKYPVGNFSGLPTQADSDRLIKLAYKEVKGKLVIIGCGGIFGVEDAWRKITYGANLVQLITGMIYQGPQLTAQVTAGLVERMEKEGWKNISEVVGSAVK